MNEESQYLRSGEIGKIAELLGCRHHPRRARNSVTSNPAMI